MRAPALALALWLSLGGSARGDVLRHASPGGLEVAAEPVPDAADVAACLRVPIGSSAELPGEEGAARSLARALAPNEFEVGVDYTRYCASGPTLDAVLGRLLVPLTTVPAVAPAPEPPDADRAARARLRSLAYLGSWPLDHDPLALRADLAELRAFQARTYGVTELALGLTGRLPANWVEIVMQKLARAPRRPPPPAPPVPRQTSPRFMRLEHAGAAAHVLYYAWPVGPAGTPEHDALSLIAHALGSGDAATLRAVFVKQRGMLRDVDVRIDRGSSGNLLTIRLELKSNVALTQVERLLSLIMARVRLSGLTPSELTRAQASLEQERSRASAAGVARARALSEPGTAPPAAAPAAAELKRAAARLADDRQTLIELVPPGFVPVREKPIAPKARVHVVVKGDTLSEIARRYRVSVAEIVKSNRLSTGSRLRIGQKLVIP